MMKRTQCDARRELRKIEWRYRLTQLAAHRWGLPSAGGAESIGPQPRAAIMSIRCGIPASIIPSQSAPAPRTIVFTMCAILLVPPIVSACGPALSASQGTSYEQRMLAPVGRQAPSDRVDRAE